MQGQTDHEHLSVFDIELWGCQNGKGSGDEPLVHETLEARQSERLLTIGRVQPDMLYPNSNATAEELEGCFLAAGISHVLGQLLHASQQCFQLRSVAYIVW